MRQLSFMLKIQSNVQEFINKLRLWSEFCSVFAFGSLVTFPDVEVCRGSQCGREGVWAGGRLGDGPRLWGTLPGFCVTVLVEVTASPFLPLSEWCVGAGAEVGSKDHRGVWTQRAHQVGDARAPFCGLLLRWGVQFCLATGRGSETQAVKAFLIWVT